MWPFLFSWLLAASAPHPAARPLLVSAAVSLTDALTECGTAFTRETGLPVTFNFGASNVLARQIAHGAPVDLFVSADERQMQFAVDAGAIAPETLAQIATNRLVVVVPGASAPRWSGPTRLAATAIRRVAIGDPLAVPAGVYARLWLQRIGLWSTVQQKVVPSSTVRGALAAVNAGAADAGVVYRTDVSASDDVSVVLDVTGPDAPAIVYPAGVVRQSRAPMEAARFITFLLTHGQEILQRYGFGRAPVAVSSAR